MIKVELYKRVPFSALSHHTLNEIVKKIYRDLHLSETFTLSCAVVSDKEIIRLNKTYRKVNKVTDVLSFRYSVTHGEIVLSAPRVRQQAKANSHSILRETKLLLIHGLLHLTGWDHERSPQEAKKMKIIENKLLKKCS